eukprot:scaffold9251_cov92-Cyclotella_meneghiniana.AAC.3
MDGLREMLLMRWRDDWSAIAGIARSCSVREHCKKSNIVIRKAAMDCWFMVDERPRRCCLL